METSTPTKNWRVRWHTLFHVRHTRESSAKYGELTFSVIYVQAKTEDTARSYARCHLEYKMEKEIHIEDVTLVPPSDPQNKVLTQPPGCDVDLKDVLRE